MSEEIRTASAGFGRRRFVDGGDEVSSIAFSLFSSSPENVSSMSSSTRCWGLAGGSGRRESGEEK